MAGPVEQPAAAAKAHSSIGFSDLDSSKWRLDLDEAEDEEDEMEEESDEDPAHDE
jgi:hypothetical protein